MSPDAVEGGYGRNGEECCWNQEAKYRQDEKVELVVQEERRQEEYSSAYLDHPLMSQEVG